MPRKKFFRARAHCNPLSDSSSLEPYVPLLLVLGETACEF